MLKWNNKPWWRDEEDGKFYIHPFLAFPIIIIGGSGCAWFLLSEPKGL